MWTPSFAASLLLNPKSTNTNWLWVFRAFSITLYSLACKDKPRRLIGQGAILASFGLPALLGDDYETAKPARKQRECKLPY